MKRVLIDTDPGDDDAAAILFCLASENVQVEALTVTYGNVLLDVKGQELVEQWVQDIVRFGIS